MTETNETQYMQKMRYRKAEREAVLLCHKLGSYENCVEKIERKLDAIMRCVRAVRKASIFMRSVHTKTITLDDLVRHLNDERNVTLRHSFALDLRLLRKNEDGTWLCQEDTSEKERYIFYQIINAEPRPEKGSLIEQVTAVESQLLDVQQRQRALTFAEIKRLQNIINALKSQDQREIIRWLQFHEKYKKREDSITGTKMGDSYIRKAHMEADYAELDRRFNEIAFFIVGTLYDATGVSYTHLATKVKTKLQIDELWQTYYNETRTPNEEECALFARTCGFKKI